MCGVFIARVGDSTFAPGRGSRSERWRGTLSHFQFSWLQANTAKSRTCQPVFAEQFCCLRFLKAFLRMFVRQSRAKSVQLGDC